MDQISIGEVEDIKKKILDTLHNSGKLKTLDLARCLGFRGKKEINRIIYQLEKEGLVMKLQDVPPVWGLKQYGDGNVTSQKLYRPKESGNNKNIEIGRQIKMGIGTRPVDMSLLSGMGDSMSKSTTESTVEGDGNSLKQKILSMLKTTSTPLTASKIAETLQFHKGEINRVLYGLGNVGTVCQCPGHPPTWVIPSNSTILTTAEVLETQPRRWNSENRTSIQSYMPMPEVLQLSSERKSHSSTGNETNLTQANSCFPSRTLSFPLQESIPDENKNAISAFQEYAQARHLEARIDITLTAGPPHNPRFQAVAHLGEEIFPEVSEKTKKDAKLKAAEAALAVLYQKAVPRNKDMITIGDSSTSYNSLTCENFAAMDKNPISAFQEYAQARHLEARIDIVQATGPPHNPKFLAVALMDGNRFPEVWDRTKKDAKLKAAEVALQILQHKTLTVNKDIDTFRTGKPSVPPLSTEYDRIASLAHQAFNETIASLPLGMLSGRKIIAAIVMSKDTEPDTVVCIGMGNRCISGDNLNLEGAVINDSHAEVLTRRAFMRFLYTEIKEFAETGSSGIIEKSDVFEKLRVKPSIKFHLYISTAPCGDGALFTRSVATESADDTGQEHRPILNCKTQGLLRTKLEAGEGTIPLEGTVVLTFDGIQRGDQRLRIMSCSDKITKWNVLGLQGALLSHFIQPVYLASITLGQLYDHGHLSRAVCCRLIDEDQPLDDLLPHTFHLNHPALGKVSSCTPTRQAEKTKSNCVNWTIGDAKPEVTDGITGECFQSNSPSQLCKAAMFSYYLELCATGLNDTNVGMFAVYKDAKESSISYQEAKDAMYTKLAVLGRGTWIQKPPEEKSFEESKHFER